MTPLSLFSPNTNKVITDAQVIMRPALSVEYLKA